VLVQVEYEGAEDERYPEVSYLLRHLKPNRCIEEIIAILTQLLSDSKYRDY
jgi:hypothetical protein